MQDPCKYMTGAGISMLKGLGTWGIGCAEPHAQRLAPEDVRLLLDAGLGHLGNHQHRAKSGLRPSQ